MLGIGWPELLVLGAMAAMAGVGVILAVVLSRKLDRDDRDSPPPPLPPRRREGPERD
jgi:hypothetical protein